MDVKGKKMKNIHFLYDFLKELGGLEKMVFFHANVIHKKKGMKPQIFFAHVEEREKAKIISELGLNKGIPVSQLGKSRFEILNLAKALLIPWTLTRQKKDLNICYSYLTTRIAYEKKKRDGTPYVVVICHPPNFLYTPVKGWANNISRFLARMLGLLFGFSLKKLDKKVVRGADAVLSISRYTSRRVRALYDLDSQILYPPVSPFFKVLSEKEKSKFYTQKNITRPYLYAHGRIIPDKNYDFLIHLLQKIPDTDLIISGTISPTYKAELTKKIISANLSSRIKILGRVSNEDARGYYNCAKAFIVPAKKEDFGITLVESVACGCPVVAWDDDAGPSEIISSASGLLAKPYSLSDFLEKVSQVSIKQWDKKKMANSIRKFQEKELGKQLSSVVDSVIRKSNI